MQLDYDPIAKTTGESRAYAPAQSALSESRWQLLVLLVGLLILFSGLGSAALFEPDEGRNAEKAREILLLGDWVTPHQNFLPTLDKPMFSYWLIAAAFKIFGLSEWAARLPSTLAALGCLFLIHRFARRQWGLWEALWSCLVLVTSLQFVIFSRLVIFDMTLTFFITWALFSFYRIAEDAAFGARRRDVVSLYVAMALGTLVKGPIALIAPGMVILGFLLLTRRWALLKQINLPLGCLLYLAIVVPWYVAAEIRNPGYLRYFFWDEHFARYLTPRFNRSKGWYYFPLVISVGFLPWTLNLPMAIKRCWQQRAEPVMLFLALWVILPFAFFSASNSKLPHYILPIFPALALLVGRSISAALPTQPRAPWMMDFLAPWILSLSCMLYLLVGAFAPQVLVGHIRSGVVANRALLVAAALTMILVLSVALRYRWQNRWQDRGFPYLCSATGLALFMTLLTQIVASASFKRVSKPLAQAAAPHLNGQEQLAFYDTYVEGIPFYFRIDKPAWLVQSPGRTSIMASNYLALRRPPPVAGYGPVLLPFEEFAARWKSGKTPLLVIVRENGLGQFSASVGATPTELARFENYRLVTNR